MSHWSQEKHPMCTCGPVTFGGKTSGMVTVEGCRMAAKATYGIDPHPVLNAEDLEALMADFRERLGVTA